MQDTWQELKIGDRVRIVRIPSFFAIPGAQVDEEMLLVYQQLVAARAVLAIEEIDEFGHPWTEGFAVDDGGNITTGIGIGQFLALNDDSWERVDSD